MASLDKKFKPKHKLSFHTIMNKGVHWIPQNAQRYTYIYIYMSRTKAKHLVQVLN